MLVLLLAWKASAQGSLDAMLGYVGSSPTNSVVYSAISSNPGTTLGWTFQPTANIDVTALGAFSYVLQNPGNLEIGLWNASGTLLASSTISVTGISGTTVYQSITPLMLLAGQTYYLGACSPTASLYFYVVGPDSDSGGSATMSPEIQLGIAAYNTGSSFAFPGTTTGNPGDAIIAPNFQFQVVPEPSVSCLLSSVTVILFAIRQRRIKSPAAGV